MLDDVHIIESEADPKEPVIFRLWRWWKVVWSVLRNIIYILAVLVAYGRLNSAFENVALSVLLLILQTVTWARTIQLRFMIEERSVNKRISLLLLKKLGEDTEEAEQALAQEESNYKKLTPVYYINLGADTILYLIILWKVFSTLLA